VCVDSDELLHEALRKMMPSNIPGLNLEPTITGLSCANLPLIQDQCNMLACPMGLCCASCKCEDQPPSPPAAPGGCVGDNEVLLALIANELQGVVVPEMPKPPPPPLPPPSPPGKARPPPPPPAEALTCAYVKETGNCPALCYYADFVCCGTCGCGVDSWDGGDGDPNSQYLRPEDLEEFPGWMIVAVALLIVGWCLHLFIVCQGGMRGLTNQLRSAGWFGEAKPPEIVGFIQGDVFVDDPTSRGGSQAPSRGASKVYPGSPAPAQAPKKNRRRVSIQEPTRVSI